MTPVVQLYWLRVVLGIVAGAISAILAGFLFAGPNDITPINQQHNCCLTHILHNILYLKRILQRTK